VRIVAFLFALGIAAVGVTGIVRPTALARLAQYFVTPGSSIFWPRFGSLLG
jgi:hypothetical protein